jgi:plastocyanin
MMRRVALIVLAVLGATAAPAGAETKDVSVANFAFAPTTVDIAPGDSVRWTFAGPDLNHSTTSQPGQAESWDSDPGNASPFHPLGDTFTHTFNATGGFAYVCKVHASMRATVRVTAPGQEPPPGADTTAPTAGALRVSVKRRRATFRLDEAARVDGKLRGPRTRRTLTLDAARGTNVLKLPSRLRAGRWSLTITATDAAGNDSTPVAIKFSVPRP